MGFSIFHEARVGGRAKNEDFCDYTYTDKSLFMVLADGMGGHLYGEIASRLVVTHMIDCHLNAAKPIIEDHYSFLSETCKSANRVILEYASINGLLEIPRTTVVACLIQNGMLYHAHLGDSRLYVLGKDGELKRRTKDHTRIQYLMDHMEISVNEVLFHPDRNKVYNCLGLFNPSIPSLEELPLSHGDIVILCSDGLWNYVTEQEMWGYTSVPPLSIMGSNLMDLAESRGGVNRDNLTLMALLWSHIDISCLPDVDTVLSGYATQKNFCCEEVLENFEDSVFDELEDEIMLEL
ncbi:MULTISPECIES: PP2C family protein-serine/threonine phosphatase [Candidatus Ichthyocystis]|uniref:PP2C family protein-serine/threonine phosphatase n=1 Tax=Candidatus Ichthyocystis TaxID=2929841 RepID=UPI000B83D11A|nr:MULTISPECIES: protein phosphatase 2C domain-containing protein [Ichthyocystis]